MVLILFNSSLRELLFLPLQIKTNHFSNEQQ